MGGMADAVGFTMDEFEQASGDARKLVTTQNKLNEDIHAHVEQMSELERESQVDEHMYNASSAEVINATAKFNALMHDIETKLAYGYHDYWVLEQWASSISTTTDQVTDDIAACYDEIVMGFHKCQHVTRHLQEIQNEYAPPNQTITEDVVTLPTES